MIAVNNPKKTFTFFPQDQLPARGSVLNTKQSDIQYVVQGMDWDKNDAMYVEISMDWADNNCTCCSSLSRTKPRGMRDYMQQLMVVPQIKRI